ncbi:MAG: MMPL family transporter [Chloroflexota bacterium]|nr:MMPL family transporter [Chloroflexota bacterium]
MNTPARRSAIAGRIASFLTQRSTAVIAIILAITALLVFPMIFLHPDDRASQEPGGPVFDLRDKVNAQFPPRLHIASFIVEDRAGDLLRQAPLWELYRNGKALRESDMADLLFSGYDVETQRQLQGIYSLADAVNFALAQDPTSEVTLETASDSQVKSAINRVLDGPQGRVMLESLSRDATLETVTVEGEERQEWRARAASIFVAADNAKLGGGPYTIGISNDESVLEKERLNRGILSVLRGNEEHYRLWGVGLDANLTSREQGETAIPYIVATVILVLLVVGATLRSVKAVVLGFVGLMILVVWLRGITNLIGLNGSLILDLIVPIAMISLGADFLIHAVARYNEERVRSRLPVHALRAGLGGVLGALVLASLSDGIAFLANVTSGIESVIGFGVAAGIAVLSNFIIMGILIPLVIMRLDQRKAQSLAAGTNIEIFEDRSGPGTPRSNSVMARVILTLARAPWAVLPVVALGTALTTYLAFQLEPQFDAEDFLDSDSQFVIGVNKLDEHIAPSLSGEPAIIYVRGDLTDPQSLAGLRELLDRLGDNENVGRGQDGEVFTYGSTIFQLLERVVGSEAARQAVETSAGVAITDHNLDGQPDESDQLKAAYEYMLDHGIPLDEQSIAYERERVGEILSREGSEYATIITLGVLGAREQANLATARESLNLDVAPLATLPSISEVGITGSPFTREATLMATTRALTISLPIAAGACFLLLAFWMRSVGYAFITTLPVGLVVSWLYAFMYVTGYSLNFVTATIAAVSIGVGIDYSIHMTQRFRQELPLHPGPVAALQTAASGTGAALAGSAASSIAGFAVLGFAPMPLFSTYGIISAVMVLMAGSAALLVLPSMLLLVARARGRKG